VHIANYKSIKEKFGEPILSSPRDYIDHKFKMGMNFSRLHLVKIPAEVQIGA